MSDVTMPDGVEAEATINVGVTSEFGAQAESERTQVESDRPSEVSNLQRAINSRIEGLKAIDSSLLPRLSPWVYNIMSSDNGERDFQAMATEVLAEYYGDEDRAFEALLPFIANPDLVDVLSVYGDDYNMERVRKDFDQWRDRYI